MVQIHALADHGIEVELALAIELQIVGGVDVKTVGAHQRAGEGLLQVEMARFQGEALTPGNGPHDHRLAPRGQAVEALGGQGGVAHRVEGVVHPAAAHALDLFDRVDIGVGLTHQHGVGSAETLGYIELVGGDVDGDDLAGAGDAGSLDDGVAHPAGAEHRHR